MQTDLLGKLVKMGKSVAVICPDVNDLNISRYCQEKNVALYGFEAKNNFRADNHFFARKYFLEDIETNPALYEKHIWATHFNTSRNLWRRLRPHYYWILYKARRKYPLIKEWFKKKEKRYLVSQRAYRLLQHIHPRKLISTYPVNLNEAVLLHNAEGMEGVETWIHLLSWDNITCKGIFPAVATKYIAWGEVMRDELLEYYHPDPSDIFICGVPHFDLHYDVSQKGLYRDYVTHLGLFSEKPYMFFAMSAPRFSPHEIDVVEWIADKVSKGYFGEMQFIVRPHPQNVEGNFADKSWLPRLHCLNQLPNVAVDFPRLVKSKINWSMEMDDMTRMSNLLSGASVTLNSCSTVSIESLILKRPVILTVFDSDREIPYWRSVRRMKEFPHLRKLIAMGGVSLASNYNELENLIRLYIDYPNYLLGPRDRTVELECYRNDGKATERVIEVLA